MLQSKFKAGQGRRECVPDACEDATSERYTAANTIVWYVLITIITFVVTTSFVIHCRLSPDVAFLVLLPARFLTFAVTLISILTIPIFLLTSMIANACIEDTAGRGDRGVYGAMPATEIVVGIGVAGT